MYQEFYKGHFLLSLPVFALLLFMTLFAVATWMAWTKGRRTGEDDRLAQLPLSDETRPAAPTAGEQHV